MTRSSLMLLAVVVGTAVLFVDDPHRRLSKSTLEPSPEHEGEESGPYPSDWFGMQRAFPLAVIPQGKFGAAFEQAQMERAAVGLSTSATAALAWTLAGPTNIGGRVTSLAVAPGGSTIYLGSANGGVFKSVNSGTNWTPIFDQLGVYSIGALCLDPANAGVLYVGTGEANSSVDSYDGNGVYRSVDGGVTWKSLGLESTARIARVRVDPQNSNRIYVAAMGPQFSTSPDRGLYRSTDGGATWTKTLFVNDSTGACDVVINPVHPETVYCATWERVRRPSYRRAFGPGCGIWRSTNHGATWTRLQTGLPAPSDDVGRIGLAIAASRPSTVYAQIITGSISQYRGLGLYRSTDGGTSWTKRDVGSTFTNNFGGFGWYFGDLAVDPTNPDRLFALGVGVIRSIDGGVNFTNYTGSAHVDQHASWIDPANPQRIYLGNDGGFFYSLNGGVVWVQATDLPITQFYAGAIDPSNSARLLGGTQDNQTVITSGPPGAWGAILGGDGFYCLVDPSNPMIVFAEYQNGSGGSGPFRSTNGGGTWTMPTGFVASDRFNWCTPFVMDPSNRNVLLAGSHRVYKSTDNGLSYTPVSGDLTTSPPALLTYGTITTLAISPVNSSLYYAGTDDGRVWRSTNAGGSWTNISAGLPVRWVTRVTADPVSANTVYVTHSGFGMDEHLVHVHRSTNAGSSWTSIEGNLPDIPANDILVDPADNQTLFLATDVGVYVTRNLGAGWAPLGTGMPVQTVFDLTLHAPTRTLVAATHGRSQWKLDLAGLPLAADAPSPPRRFSLSSPTPNPSRAAAHLELELSNASRVDVVVYDVTGRRVNTLLERSLPAGRHPLAWDGKDALGRRVEAGVYFVRASASSAIVTRRVIRIE